MKTVSLLQCCVLMVLVYWSTADAQDVCTLPKAIGHCKGLFPRYFFNSESGRCEQFGYGGCGGNGNRFETQQQCGERCGDICSLPKVPGPCKRALTRVYYDSDTGRCDKFTYGGCRSNGNKFSSRKSCSKKCKDLPDTCYQPKKTGTCDGHFPKYYYNAWLGRCEEFVYGGCGGNNNRFETRQECGDLCGDVCTFPMAIGHCRGLFPRYFFNSTSGRCEQFGYGGCGGNGNRFETQQQCGEQCGDVCILPSDTGPCEALIDRYFYNSATKECEKFTYGGCEGNGNNFQTLEQCTDRCVGPA